MDLTVPERDNGKFKRPAISMDRGGRPLSLEDFIGRGADLEEMSGRLGASGRENAHFKSAEIVVVFRNPPVFKYQLGKTVKPSVVFDPCRVP